MTEPRDKLATVRASPEAVAAHDKAKWLSIFARYNIVEDPVGSQPHLSGVFDRRTGRRGDGPLSRFFDTFIAPNDIAFHVERDIVCHNAVVRDLEIEIAMGPRVRVRVPMHLLYELVEEEGQFKIFRLAAHWEFLPMVRQAMGFGWDSIRTMSALGWRMLRLQGVSGIAGFCQALFGVGAKGKQRVDDFVCAWNEGDRAAIEALFDASGPGLQWPVAEASRDWAATLVSNRPPRLRVEKLLAAGYTVSASCELGEGSESVRGVILFEFTGGRLLHRVSGYWPVPDQAASSSSDSG